jgi:hypothetical protein
MKNWILAAFILSFTSVLRAQVLRPVKLMIYGGYGISVPSGYMKVHSQLGNGNSFRGGFILPVMDAGSNRRLAIELCMDYSRYAAQLKAPEALDHINYDDGQSVLPVNFRIDPGTKKPDAFRFLAGPSLLLEKKRLVFQISFLAGYSSVSQEPFSFTDSIRSSADPSQNTRINFYSSGHATNNGLVLVPGLKIGWRCLNRLSVLAAADYSFGPAHHFTDRVFLPLGDPQNDVYMFSQLKNGSVMQSERTSRLKAFALQACLAFTL